MAREKVVQSFAIEPALWGRVCELADIAKRSRSSYVAEVLRDHVEEQGEAIRAMQHPVLGPALLQAFGNREVLKAVAEVVGDRVDDRQLQLFKKTVESLQRKPGKKPRPRPSRGKAKRRR